MTKFSQKNKVELIRNGDSFIQESIGLINTAKDFIILQTYIFEKDVTTLPVIDALKKRAYDGVQVYILIDGFGSRDFPKEIFEQKNIHFKFFSPIFSSKLEHLGRRIHSKVIICDSKLALLGGINLSQRFNNPINSKPWLDYAIKVEGEEVFNIINSNLYLYKKYFTNFLKTNLPKVTRIPVEHKCFLKSNTNDGMRFKNEIYRSYVSAMKGAKSQITIVAPYFFPGKKFLNILAKASKRGVEVNLIFSAESDHPIERWSSRYLYSWFLTKNINIYEWSESIVHGKMAYIDDKWITVGSYNHNFMSRYGNHEFNLEVIDIDFAKVIKNEVNAIIKKSNLITLEKWERKNTYVERSLEALSYVFANFLTIISMLLIIKRKDDSDFNLLE